MAAKIIFPNIFHFIPAIKNYRGDSSGWNWLMEYMYLSPILPETPWKWQCRHLKIHNQQGQQKLGGKKEKERDVHGRVGWLPLGSGRKSSIWINRVLNVTEVPKRSWRQRPVKTPESLHQINHLEEEKAQMGEWIENKKTVLVYLYSYN